MIIAPCPSCGLPCRLKHDKGWNRHHGFAYEQVECPACDYTGPADIDPEVAVRKHNKISQNCGACP
jgi:hypothetical protein